MLLCSIIHIIGFNIYLPFMCRINRFLWFPKMCLYLFLIIFDSSQSPCFFMQEPPSTLLEHVNLKNIAKGGAWRNILAPINWGAERFPFLCFYVGREGDNGWCCFTRTGQKPVWFEPATFGFICNTMNCWAMLSNHHQSQAFNFY